MYKLTHKKLVKSHVQMGRMSIHQTQAGFTLIEVLIAMVILSVAIISWMNTQQAAVLNRGQSRTMTVAAELVQAKIEELSLDPGDAYSNVCEGKEPLNFVCQKEGSYTIGGFEYIIQWNLLQIDDIVSDSRPFWDIEVEASWNYRGEKTYNSKRIVMERPQ